MLESGALEYQQRWGCPAADLTPPDALDPDLAEEARQCARVTGTPAARTCPLACLLRADPWVAELTHAVAIRGVVPDLTVTLGRPLTGIDIQALQAITTATSEATVSELRAAEERRKRTGTGGGAGGSD